MYLLARTQTVEFISSLKTELLFFHKDTEFSFSLEKLRVSISHRRIVHSSDMTETEIISLSKC